MPFIAANVNFQKELEVKEIVLKRTNLYLRMKKYSLVKEKKNPERRRRKTDNTEELP